MPAYYTKYLSLSWDINTPLSNRQFLGNASATGIKLSYRKRLSDFDNIWGGIDLGLVGYSQHFPYQTYYSSSAATSADFYNYATNFSVTCSIDYLLVPTEKKLIPFVGLALGGASTNFTQYYNVNTATDHAWGLLVRPEAGVIAGFKANSAWRLKAGLHYDFASNTSTFAKNNFLLLRGSEYKNFINAGVELGLVKMIR